MTYDTCVIEGIQTYEKLIAPELCWPLMKLSSDCCINGNSKQWICKILKKKQNSKRVGPLIIAGIVAGLLGGLAATLGITAAVSGGLGP